VGSFFFIRARPTPARPPPFPAGPPPAPAVTSPPALAPQRVIRPAPPASVAEAEWARRNPEGRVTRTGRDEWLLWNFGIGSDQLRPEHAGALREVCASLAAAPGSLVITGFASASGSVSRNVRLSTDRARSTAEMLRAFGAQASLVTIRGQGERAPGVGPEAAARDRAVVIQVPARDTRRPLPAPEAPGRIEWKPKPEQPSSGPAPERSLVGLTFEYKFSVRKVIPFGSDWFLVGEIEIGGKGEFAPRARTVVAASYKKTLDVDQFREGLQEGFQEGLRKGLQKGKYDEQIKVALTNSVVLSGSFREKTVAVQFKGIPLQPELGVGLGNLLASPRTFSKLLDEDPKKLFTVASVKFSLPAAKSEEYDLGDLVPALRGFHVRGTIQPKVIVSLAPSPFLLTRLGTSLAARMGPAAGPVGAGIVLGTAWTVLALYLIDRAHKRGENWAHVVDLRRGYAYRLAAEVLDWRPGQVPGSGSARAWDEARATILNVLPHSRPGQYSREQSLPMKQAYANLYEGWEAAGEALQALDRRQYDEVMPRLRELGGPTFPKLSDMIMRRLGGTTEKETPLDLSWLHGPR
jgi:outer membrane protein OmpA-like peptidoglycan-associated protein